MLKWSVLATSLLASSVSAEMRTCPIGGARFEAPVGARCPEDQGSTMLLVPVGCPPPPLPQCPQNFLPLYRRFTASELPLVAQYMQSESYESSVDFSPWLLAYDVEKFLNGPDKTLPMTLLQAGLWQTPALATDRYFRQAFSAEVEARLPYIPPEQQAKELARLAFLALLAGDRRESQAYMARAESTPPLGPEARSYLVAVRACLVDQSQLHCRARAAIPAP